VAGSFFLLQLARAFYLIGCGDLDLIQRIGHRGKMPARQMQVQRGVLDLGVAEQDLNGAQISAGFQQVRGKAVP
jgi:hypothetical protein